MKPGIAFFDFDGTITKRDTLLEFIKFTKGPFRFMFGFLVNSPWLIAYKLRVISNQKAKERILRYFFGGMSADKFNEYAGDFSEKKIPLLLKNTAENEILRLKNAGFIVVIVSASAENWIKKWTDVNNLCLIGTKLEIIDGKITGKIIGKNCYGNEKVTRIKKEFNLVEYSKIYAFGDSKGDKPMLELSQEPQYKPFQ